MKDPGLVERSQSFADAIVSFVVRSATELGVPGFAAGGSFGGEAVVQLLTRQIATQVVVVLLGHGTAGKLAEEGPQPQCIVGNGLLLNRQSHAEGRDASFILAAGESLAQTAGACKQVDDGDWVRVRHLGPSG